MTTTTVQVRSAVKLGSADIKTITKFAAKQLGHSADLAVTIDPTLIAGFKLNINGLEYDYSVVGSLDQLAQEL